MKRIKKRPPGREAENKDTEMITRLIRKIKGLIHKVRRALRDILELPPPAMSSINLRERRATR